MAKGPLRYAQSYNICLVNDYKLHTTKHSKSKVVDNSKVCVKAAKDTLDVDDLYGHLEEFIELEYLTMPIKKMTMLKCK